MGAGPGVGGHQGRVWYRDTLGMGTQQDWGHPVVHPRRGDTLDAVMGAPRSPVWHPWVQPAGSMTLLVPRPPQGHRWGLSQAVSPPAKPRDVGRKLWVLAGPSEAHPRGRGTSGPPPSSGIISGDTRGESSAVPRGRCTATSSPASPGKGRNGCWGLVARKVGSTPGCWLGLGRAQRSPVHAPSLSILGSEEGSPGQMAAPKGIPVSIPAAHRQTLELWYPTGGSPGW